MACLYFSKDNIDTSSATHKACLFIDCVLYPLITVICSVVFLLLFIVKFIFLSLKFLIMQSSAACGFGEKRCIQESFKSFSKDFWGCLLIIPLVGSMVYGLIYCLIHSEEIKNSDMEYSRVFMAAPLHQVVVTATHWT
ncbi:hypothetical protein C10C_0214 [Chlamydia serpentis]|uniref:Uncharacterized protein n=1 Tax=Chlamydia serpentis TaxID=1967782 RepID=A0A2R8FAP2_9CHLA|nr:hypothetical protein [Chlamydia serpentis]SPN73392.1 hypothetical protein C10C_0214 [Chlamydia serpentis]